MQKEFPALHLPRATSRRVSRLLAAFLVFGCAASAEPEESTLPEKEELRIVTAHGVNLRSGPSLASTALKQLGIGARVRVLSQSAEEEEIGGVRGRWLEVEDATAARGWLFGGLTAVFDPAYPARAFEPLVRHLRDFAAGAALESAIAGAEAEYGSSAELELLRLAAIDATGRRFDGRIGEQRAWVERHADVLWYFEPGGFHFVDPAAYQELLERYPSSPAAETIAWRAAQPPMSHCEDDANCWLEVGWRALGGYLERYPAGVYADSALMQLARFSGIAAEYACWNEETGEPRVESALLREVRDVLGPVRSSHRERIDDDIETIERKCSLGAGR